MLQMPVNKTSFRKSVTQIKYTMAALDADSSMTALSSPSAGVMDTVLNASGKTYCDCRAYRVRMLWTTDRKEFNSTVIQSAVSKAWMGVNKGMRKYIHMRGK
jgi:hypothetical protein